MKYLEYLCSTLYRYIKFIYKENVFFTLSKQLVVDCTWRIYLMSEQTVYISFSTNTANNTLSKITSTYIDDMLLSTNTITNTLIANVVQ